MPERGSIGSTITQLFEFVNHLDDVGFSLPEYEYVLTIKSFHRQHVHTPLGPFSRFAMLRVSNDVCLFFGIENEVGDVLSNLDFVVHEWKSNLPPEIPYSS